MTYQEQLNELIFKISHKIDELSQKIDNLELRYEKLSREAPKKNNGPIFHSLTKPEEVQTKLKEDERIKTELSRTADLVLLDYKHNPPKRRR